MYITLSLYCNNFCEHKAPHMYNTTTVTQHLQIIILCKQLQIAQGILQLQLLLPISC